MYSLNTRPTCNTVFHTVPQVGERSMKEEDDFREGVYSLMGLKNE